VALRNGAGPAQRDDAGEARKVTHADAQLSRPTQNQAQEGAGGSFATRTPGDGWVFFDTLSRDRRTGRRRFHLIDGGST
jgi:hypothetical protein